MSRVAITAEQRRFGEAIAATVRAARIDAGLTVRDLSKVTGLSIDTLRTLEAGRVASPGFALICAVVDALGADLTAFARRAPTAASGGDRANESKRSSSPRTRTRRTRPARGNERPE